MTCPGHQPIASWPAGDTGAVAHVALDDSGFVNVSCTPSNSDLALMLCRMDTSEVNSRSLWTRMAIALARIPLLRDLVMLAICRIEGGEMWSPTFRALMRRYHAVNIGRYSYGSSLWAGTFPRGTRIGHYCSLAGGIQVFRRNHPVARIGMHPFFYNARCGLVGKDTIPAASANPLEIAHDVWIGANAIITPRCCRIGIGAVVGAGSVVTADVPDFYIVAGNPARLVRKRFSDETCVALLDSCWWAYHIRDLIAVLPLFLVDATPDSVAQLREHLQSNCYPMEDFPD